MDELIHVELTLDEGRVLLALAIAALTGEPYAMDDQPSCVAANSAAAKLQNRIAACACNADYCGPRERK